MNFPLTVLGVIDGFGYSGQSEGNAIHNANTPNLDYLWSNFPHFLLKAAEEEVGLSFGEIGNSEVGHITIGSGRVIPQNMSRINGAIEDGSFFQNPALLEVVNHVKSNRSRLHLLGIISTAGVHGHLYHYQALIRLAATHGVDQLFLHLILDGRDSGPKDSPYFLREIDKTIRETKLGTYASICGRGLIMDRNNNWELIEQGYNLLLGQAKHSYPTPKEAIDSFYSQGLDDENIPPCLITHNQTPEFFKSNDGLIISNFREDRARQITQALSFSEFTHFARPNHPQNFKIATLTSYEHNMPVSVAFPPPRIDNTLSDVFSQQGLSQIHIAETEKYAHVTYFFNGGREDKTSQEEFFMIPSLKPDKFETNPEMSAAGVAEAVIKSIDLGYQVIIFNFANPDMVGHTGNYAATIKAIETVDYYFKLIWDKVSQKNGTLFITADHGNSEQMINLKTGGVLKEHTIAPVPFIIAHNNLFQNTQQPTKIMHEGVLAGLLSDVAPTILSTLNLSIPTEMTGAPLAKINL